MTDYDHTVERMLATLTGADGAGFCFMDVRRDGAVFRIVARLERDGGIGAVRLGRVSPAGRLMSMALAPFALTEAEAVEAVDRIEGQGRDVADAARRAGL